MKRLEGRVALISGALRGIGLAIAERYHTEGATVLLADLADPGDSTVVQTIARFEPPSLWVASFRTEGDPFVEPYE